jgi:D-alanine-D-alanine ligase
MKIALVYNRESQAVINLFGVPNREKYGLGTIKAITGALKAGKHQVKSFEGDKNIAQRLEDFMPAVLSGERPGLVFNLSYGIQGKARYTHIPGILEMLGIPYVGSSPDTHGIALDKLITKIILRQKGLPTPNFDILDNPDSKLGEELRYPLIVKPKNEAVSYGLRVVHNEAELREGVEAIYEKFQQPTLVEEYIQGREINVGLLGNNPNQALPPVELDFGEGEAIFTYEDKTHRSGREIGKICPAPLSEKETERLQNLAVDAFNALGCYDFARVDFRLDHQGEPYILEINSMASLGKGGSYVYAASKIGLDYDALVNRIVEVTSQRYFSTPEADQIADGKPDKEKAIFTYVTGKRDNQEKELTEWANLSSRTNDAVGLASAVRKLEKKMQDMRLEPVEELTNGKSAWTWQSRAGLENGILLVVNLDVPIARRGFLIPVRREPEWFHGEGIASSRGGLVCMLGALGALRSVRRLRRIRLGVFACCDEGRGMRYSSEIFRKAASRARAVIVLKPGLREGKFINQRRGMRKYNLVAEGNPQRIGLEGGKLDVLSWFLSKTSGIGALSEKAKRLTVTVQDVKTQKYSILMPHQIESSLGMAYLNTKHADAAEARLNEILRSDSKTIRSSLEMTEDRPALSRKGETNPLLVDLEKLCEEWKLPFGVGSSLLPSAAGWVPENIPVVCGFGPPGRDLYTPNEAVHRGELLQRTLLLALLLGLQQK